ncbi:unnamed protein product [Calypogeia fissa]
MSYYQRWWWDPSPIQDYPDKYEEFKAAEGVRWDPMEFSCMVGADSSFVDFLKASLLFFIRLVAFAYPTNSWVRFLYDFTLTELWLGARSYLPEKLPRCWSLSKSGDHNGPP